MAHRDDFDDDFLDDDSEAFDYKPISSEEGGGSKGVKIFIAATVIAAIGGAAWYFVGDNQSSGDNVPVVRADTQPTKEKPSDPGGMKVANRDKTVYQRLSGQNSEPKLERLLPRAEQPLDKPVVGLTLPQAEKAPAPAQKMAEKTVEAAKGEAKPLGEVPSEQMAAAIKAPAPVQDPNAPRALVKREVTKAPIQKQDQDNLTAKIAEVMNDGPAKETKSAKASAPVAAPKPVVKTAPPPPAPVAKPKPPVAPKPVQIATAPAKKPASKPIAKPTTKTAPKGSYLLQLLSSKNEGAVQKTWKKIKGNNADILGNVHSSVVKADLGDKGIYYRLRLGPIGAADKAKDLCSKLKVRKVGCFIVKVR